MMAQSAAGGYDAKNLRERAMSPSTKAAPPRESQPPGGAKGAPSSASSAPTAPPHRRYRKDARLAQVYEREILPLWTRRFGRLLLREPQLPQKAMVLDVLCGTGFVALELLQRAPEGARVVAIDSSPVLLDVARQKAGAAAGRRVFFRSELAEPRLPFDSDVFDLVLCNLGLWDVAEPRLLLHEMVRVAKPGARVAATMPLIGTFAELYDLFAGVLDARGLREAERRLRAHISRMPSALEAKSWLFEAGLHEARVDCDPFTLLFAGGRELFFSPLIEYGSLPDWKEIVGPGAEMQEVFWQLKDAIDETLRGAPGTPAMFQGGPPRPFAVTVRAGCLSGRKPAGWGDGRAEAVHRPEAAERVDAPRSSQPSQPSQSAPRAPEPAAEPEEVELNTGEIDILSLMPKEDPRKGR